MGLVAACCKRPEDEKNIETNDYIYSIYKNNNYNDNKSYKKNPDLDINNIILSEYPTSIKNLEEISSKNYDIEKVKKIQKKYRSYKIHNIFIKDIKPNIQKKTTNYINKFYEHCSLGGEITTDDDFSLDGWKRYYPSNDRFFLYPKGEVFPNQIRIENADDPENLEIYEGETNYENLKHGYGVLTTPHYILKGNWRKGEFTGWGRKSMRNGDMLEGKFVNGEINGKGIFKSKESVYIGEFVNGERCGKGDLTTEKYHYVGDFKNNKFDGDGVIEFLIEGHKYEGNFEKNEINGRGIYKWKSGDIYEGELKNGKMNGHGKYTYNDGKIYEGEYINGIKEGKGKLFYKDGKSFDGNFKNGFPDGEGFYTKDGKTYKVFFSNGKFIQSIS